MENYETYNTELNRFRCGECIDKYILVRFWSGRTSLSSLFSVYLIYFHFMTNNFISINSNDHH